MSKRSDFADDFAEFLKTNGLDEVYGVDLALREIKGKKVYEMTFCIARILDAFVRIYSENFIMVKWQTQYRDMPQFGQEVFKSVDEAKAFILKSFVRK